ncbi:MAG: Ni/Fe hydrogenase subunit alpha [Candidatus Hodarchaeota archaeon]
MKQSIAIDRFTRVEGHGRLFLELEDGKVKDVQLSIFEGPRLFEAFLKGRKYDEVPPLVSRICGICSASHILTGLIAVENAMDIQISEQTHLLRELLDIGEIIQSNVLHACFLALPDYLGAPSAIALVDKHEELVKTSLELKDLGNNTVRIVGGRAVHPITTQIGGFSKIPSKNSLEALENSFKNLKNQALNLVEFFSSLKYPDFERETDFVALKGDKKYEFLNAPLVSSEEGIIEISRYKEYIEEYTPPYSNSKACKRNGKGFIVGALSRMNLNYNLIDDEVKPLIERTEIEFPNKNPHLISFAQIVEVAHLINRGIAILEELKNTELKPEKNNFEVKEGEGIAVTEAPRGALLHHYKFDEKGLVEYANIITPTCMNNRNIEEDIIAYTPQLQGKTEKEITFALHKLVRAYDPCISCSTHTLQIDLKTK